jgi:diadenosine tetraphosphate (Ap4A) HIT family hydrolase
VFLNKYPTLFGYVLVAPLRHVEQVTGDFTEPDYLDLHRLIYRTSEAIREILEPERVYVLSLGSKAANAHVHWHIAPLPPDVPLEQQQFYALMQEHGVIAASALALEEFAAALRTRLTKA